jgi:membrane fusion protein, multidrug efflux system
MTRCRHPGSRVRLKLGIILTALAAFSCGGSEQAAPVTVAVAAGATMVDVVSVVEKPLDVQLSLPGELTAYQSVAIFPRVTGFVKSVSVDRGSRVQTGDLLVTLDAPELVAQRSEAQSKLQAAQAQLSAARAKADADAGTYDRLKTASATPGVVAGNELVIAEKAAAAGLDQATAAEQSVEAARQSLNAIREMEGYLRVTAPFGGVVTERNVHPGALVGPTGAGASAPLLRVVEHNRLRLVVAVPESFTSDIRTGTAIRFSVSAYPDQSFSGTIARIAQTVDVATRTMAVELDVSNSDNRLAPGTFCQVRWPIHRSTPSLFVPSSSVAATTDRTFVIRVRDGKTEWVDVRTGLTSGPAVEVFGDLHAGDQIVGHGTDELRPGTDVRPRETRPSA